MTQQIHFVITNGGDGSNGIQWVLDDAVLDKMEELVDDGDESYASGEGLQVRTLSFPEGFDLANWLSANNIRITGLNDV